MFIDLLEGSLPSLFSFNPLSLVPCPMMRRENGKKKKEGVLITDEKKKRRRRFFSHVLTNTFLFSSLTNKKYGAFSNLELGQESTFLGFQLPKGSVFRVEGLGLVV